MDIPEYLYIQVANAITRRIDNGDLLPGERLLAERALAVRYDVAIATARRALKELRDRGLVETRPAMGTFVCSRCPR